MKKNTFEILLSLFCFVLIIQIIVMIKKMDFPVSLLFGPILFLCQLKHLNKKLHFKKFVIHFIPFVLMSILFFLRPQKEMGIYSHLYFITTLFSLFIYPSIIIFSRRKKHLPQNETKQIVLEVLAIFGFSIFFFINVIYINHLSNNHINIQSQSIIVAIILINIGVLTLFLLSNKYSSGNSQNVPPSREEYDQDNLSDSDIFKINISEMKLLHIQDRLESVMEKEKLYLDAHLTVEMLAHKIAIPRMHILYYFDYVLKSNFIEWLATYRIQFALELLQTNPDNLKLEYLADLSGFESRTTFNRYFKQYIGQTPATYRSNLLK